MTQETPIDVCTQTRVNLPNAHTCTYIIIYQYMHVEYTMICRHEPTSSQLQTMKPNLHGRWTLPTDIIFGTSFLQNVVKLWSPDSCNQTDETQGILKKQPSETCHLWVVPRIFQGRQLSIPPWPFCSFSSFMSWWSCFNGLAFGKNPQETIVFPVKK